MATLPDLSGSFFNIIQDSQQAANDLQIEYIIRNNTAIDAGFFNVEFYLSDNPYISFKDYDLGYSTFDVLLGNSNTGKNTINLTLPSSSYFWEGDDNYYVGMIIDASEYISEEDESNNQSTEKFLDYDDVQITRNAELFGNFFNVIQEPLLAGDTFNVEFGIENSSSISTEAFDVNFYISKNNFISSADYYLGSYEVTSLGANSETGILTANFTLPTSSDSFWEGKGNYYIGMIVDGYSDIYEQNENNNRNRGEFQDYDAVNVPNLADLTGNYFNVIQEPLIVGDSFNVEFGIENNSPISVESFEVNFYVSENNFISSGDEYLGSYEVTSLGANSETILTTNFTLPTGSDSFWEGDGDYYVGMIIDNYEYIDENNEDNNQNMGEFKDYDAVNITTLADLSGSFFNVIPESIDAGNTFNVEFTINNNSPVDAESFDVDFYLSTNRLISTGDEFLGTTEVSSVSGNGNTDILTNSLTLPESDSYFWEQSGTYYLGMIVDAYYYDIPERNESNNQNTGIGLDYEDVFISVTSDF